MFLKQQTARRFHRRGMRALKKHTQAFNSPPKKVDKDLAERVSAILAAPQERQSLVSDQKRVPKKHCKASQASLHSSWILLISTCFMASSILNLRHAQLQTTILPPQGLSVTKEESPRRRLVNVPKEAVTQEAKEVKQEISKVEAKEVKPLVPSSKTVSEGDLKCSPWEVNVDTWWQAHPDWEPFGENQTHTCFQLIQNPQKAQFMRALYHNQYRDRPWSDVATKYIVGRGFASRLKTLGQSFWSAFSVGYPFQTNKHKQGFQWMYVPKDPNSWAYCPAMDHTCYFLPISKCVPEYGQKETTDRRYKIKETKIPFKESNMSGCRHTFRGRDNMYANDC